jgi:hypothetical protein
MRWMLVIGAMMVGGAACGSGPAGDVSGRMDFPMSTFGGMSRISQRAPPDPAALPFDAFLPASAGAPMAVFVSEPGAYPKDVSEVVAEYDSSSPYGAFRIREEARPPQAGDADETQGMANFCQSPGASCTSTLIRLERDVPAALLYGPDGPTSVTWLERFGDTTYQLIVIGPDATLSPDTATRVAREVAAGFNPAAASTQ